MKFKSTITQFKSKTIISAVLASSMVIALQAANDSSRSSSGQGGDQSQAQQSTAATQSGSQSAGQKMLLDQLPKPVQKTILQHSAGANPEHIQQITKNGRQCYTASFDRAGMKEKVTVAQDGSLLSLQQSDQFTVDVELPKLEKSTIKFNELPQPVQQAIQQQAGSAQIGDLSQSQVDGKPLYRADFNREGVRHELFITPQGKIAAQVQETAFAIEPMQNVRSLSLSDAPQAVQQAVRQNAKGGQVSDIDKADWNDKTVYSVMVDKNGRLSQWIFDQNGKVVEEPGRQVNDAAGADNSKLQD
jgi:hypothetical protein